MDVFWERIKPLFDNSKKSNAELEREMGIPPKTINKWTSGIVRSWQKYIPQIASYFNVSTDYLLGNTDDPAPPGSPSPVSASENAVPFQLTEPARELLDIFLSLNETAQIGLLEYARFLTRKKADAPMEAESNLA